MYTHLLALPFALVTVVGTAQAATNTLFIAGNVMTGQTWHAAQNAGDGTSGGCSVTPGIVEYYRAPFFTDQTADTYSLQLDYPLLQSGFVYLYQDHFDPRDPCHGIFAFGLAPTVSFSGIHLDASRQYFLVTSEAVLYGGEGSFHVTLTGPVGSHLFIGNGPGTAVPFCKGDGFDPDVLTPCPCGNTGASGHGCNNSIQTGGALLTANGTLDPDTLVLQASQVPAPALSIFLQGNGVLSPALPFGDGVRCVGGSLIRIGVKVALRGTATYPEAGDPCIRTLAARRADAIPPGAIRYYQVYYRDPDTAFCPNPPGDTWNVSNGIRVTWP
jgi:hypothetical protein